MNSGCTVWFTGMSGSGKSTLSNLLAQRLRDTGARVEVLDGDLVRTHLCKDLGFSRADREENIRRIGFLCELLSRNGVIAIVAAISPYRESREEVRSRLGNFIEVYMRCPMEILIQRDVKGLYKKALAGEIGLFTGISDPYEPPLEPEVMIDSSTETPGEGLAKILDLLQDRGILQTRAASIADSSTALRTGEWVLGQSQLPPR
ncbi:MAG: adenylyl-sulfate kinase [Bryobacteraceae bacterium]